MQKATGVVRKIDELGRIVLPIELRRTLSLEEGNSLEIFTNDKEEIVLKKYQPGCAFCYNVEHLWNHKGKPVCQKCVNTLAECASTKRSPEEITRNGG